MPTYIYETTDLTRPIRRFEVKQAFAEKPLLLDPETGELVRRVIIGVMGLSFAAVRLVLPSAHAVRTRRLAND